MVITAYRNTQDVYKRQFLSCFTKLAAKSSKAAKLFNSVQKAQVSWKRIQPFMQDAEPEQDITAGEPAGLVVSGLSFSYQGGPPVFQEVSFSCLLDTSRCV